MAGSQPVWVLSVDLLARVINVFTIPHTASAGLNPALVRLPHRLVAREILQSPQSGVEKNISFAELIQNIQFLSIVSLAVIEKHISFLSFLLSFI